jgi:hypothetical protein
LGIERENQRRLRRQERLARGYPNAIAKARIYEAALAEPGATPAIVRAYCMCMNEKMDENETKSITQWEKTHPAERKACDKQAGWK